MQVNETKVHPEAATFLQWVTETEKVTVAEALRATMTAYPDVTRVSLKHAAAAAGINWKTARNVWDRAHKGA